MIDYNRLAEISRITAESDYKKLIRLYNQSVTDCDRAYYHGKIILHEFLFKHVIQPVKWRID